MWADIEEGTNLVVGIAANDDWLARDGHRAKVVRFREFGLVANRNPDFLPDLFELFLEDLFVAVNPAIGPLDPAGIRVRIPLLLVPSHQDLSRYKTSSRVAARSIQRSGNTLSVAVTQP